MWGATMGDILIVDDERDIRELISDILKDEGFTTRLAGNSDECMKEIARWTGSIFSKVLSATRRKFPW
jgi:DNA-binding NtrC family response regulator